MVLVFCPAPTHIAVLLRIALVLRRAYTRTWSIISSARILPRTYPYIGRAQHNQPHAYGRGMRFFFCDFHFLKYSR